VYPSVQQIFFANPRQILHLYAATPEFARLLLKAASESGFRESGAMGIPTSSSDRNPIMLAVRTNGLPFDSIIGYEDKNGDLLSLVNSDYVYNMLSIANERFTANKERTQKFQKAVSCIPTTLTHQDREDPEIRKQRKRAEGLAKQQALLNETSTPSSTTPPIDLDLTTNGIFGFSQ
jgi:tRNA wybutosine-synthesizing protein 3